MSRAQVRRDGLTGVRPGREARMWSRDGDGGGGAWRVPEDHPGTSYYGSPVINPPVWEELNIAGYLFTGGLAGASSILAAGAALTARPLLARRARLAATGSIAVSLAALIHDLGRPARFLNMLRVFKPTSPMSVGTWILAGYAPLTAAAAASDLTGRAPRTGRLATVGAGLLGPAVATYTGALIADTAVPLWHESRRELPFLFAGSAAAAAGGFALLVLPTTENAPALRIAVLGAVGELLVCERLHRRLGVVGEALDEEPGRRRLALAKALSTSGALGAATLARRNRLAAALSGAALLAGSCLTRFGLFAAGMASAHDPRYTIEAQRKRKAERVGSGSAAARSDGRPTGATS